jgi:Ca2+-binding RTX toxin-like protein
MNRFTTARALALGIAASAALAGGAVTDAHAANPLCRGYTSTIVGDAGANRLTGTSARDVIWAGDGDDVIDAAGGDDVVCAGAGDDRVMGGSGANTLDAGLGNDACSSAATDARIACEPGVATTFMPTRHGFNFVNHFVAIPTYVTPFGVIGQDYGLCGGMAFAALDNWRVDDSAPDFSTTPQSGSTFDYLWSRLLDSLTIDVFANLYRFNDLQWKTNAQLNAVTTAEVNLIKAQLVTRPTPVGVIIPAAGGPIWGNHQVLAIGWFTSNGSTVLKVYDPNRPDVISYLDVTLKTLGPAGSTGMNIRGVFNERYTARSAPWN